MKLFAPFGNFKGQAVQVAAEYTQEKIEVVNTDLSKLKENETLKKSTLGSQLPLLQISENETVQGTNAILRHLAKSQNSKLYGSSDLEKSQVDQWLDYCLLTLEPAVLALLLPVFGSVPQNSSRSQAARAELDNTLKVFNSIVENKQYIVGGSVSVADIAFVSLLTNYFRFLADASVRQQIPNVTKYVENLAKEQQFQKVFGPLKLAQESFSKSSLKMKLFAPFGNFKGQAIQVASQYASGDLEIEYVDLKGIKDVQEVKQSTLGQQLPLLQVDEGTIQGTNTILRYIAKCAQGSGLYGSSSLEESQVDQWLDFNLLTLEPSVLTVLLPILGWVQDEPQRTHTAKQELFTNLKVLNTCLDKKKFLVGNAVTIADIAMVSLLINYFKFLVDAKGRKQIENVANYVQNIANCPEFKQIFGTVRFASKIFTAQKVSVDMKAAPKKQEAKKAEPKKADKKEKEQQDDAGDEDATQKAMAKMKNPLDLLPETSFNLYDYKTLLVNAPNKMDAIEFLYKNIDNEGFSVWFLEYDRYEGEGEKLYITENMCNGHVQKAEQYGMRKYSIGTMGIYGDEPTLDIKGVWLWRGTGIPQEMIDHPSMEYYQKRKLDLSKEEDRKILETSWTVKDDTQKFQGLTCRYIMWFK